MLDSLMQEVITGAIIWVVFINIIRFFKPTLGVVTFSPVISSPTLPKDKVVRPEDGSISTRPDTVHGARFKVDQDSPRDVLAPASLIVVDVNPLELKIRGSSITSSRVNAMLIGDDLPKLKWKP